MVAGAIGAVGSIAGGLIGSDAADDAADAQAAAAQQSADIQQSQFAQSREDIAPWRQAGERALSLYESMLMGTPYDPTSGTARLSDDQIAALEAATTYSPEGTLAQLVEAQNKEQAVQYMQDYYAASGTPPPSNADALKYINQTLEQNPNLNLSDILTQWSGSAIGGGDISGIQDILDQQEALRAQQAQQQAGGGYTPGGGMTPEGGIDYSAFYKSPGYNFRMQEGQQALERSAAARGGLLSGQQMMAQQKYGQGIASQAWGDYMNRLASLANLGQTSTTQTSQLGANMAQGVGQAYTQAGEARASGYVGAANAWGGALSGVGSSLGSMFG